jgi:subtilisin family serine protease
MKKRAGLIATLWVGINALTVPTAASRDRFLVRIKPSAHSIEEPADRQGLQLLRSLGPGRSSFLVTGSDDPNGSLLERIQADPDVEAAERVLQVRLPEFRSQADSFDFEPTIRAWLSSATGRSLLANRGFVDYFGALAWESYLEQPSVRITQGVRAQRLATGRGVSIAIIDTRIENHPVLENVLDPGYDFVGDWPEEDGDLDEAVADVNLQQGTTVVINVPPPGPKTPGKPAAGSAWTGDEQEYALGHGTMVAGIVHRVAPEARIMPLRVFARDGSADTAGIVRAIYYAVDHGARVINMSFSTSVLSPELLRAVNYATRRGVVCVASAGNHARATMVYPASLANVLGVASTDDRDHRSAFSNHGLDVVEVAAPGEGIVTTYLDGAYAVGWGTSFSGALVSGGAALLLDISSSLDQYDVAKLLSRTAERTIDDPDQGRVDFWRAARAAALTRAYERAPESGAGRQGGRDTR